MTSNGKGNGEAKRQGGRGRLAKAVAKKLGLSATLDKLARGESDPHELTHGQRRALLVLAAHERSQVELADLFGVSRRTIQKDLVAIRRQVGREVSLDVIVGGLVLAAEALSEQALAVGDVATAWRITKERVEVLRELGYLKEREEKGGHLKIAESLSAGYQRASEALAGLSGPDRHALTGEVLEPPSVTVGPVPGAREQVCDARRASARHSDEPA